MDYFNQHTYAEVSASMISEIAYTETVTFWSTLISIPFMFLGGWSSSASNEASKTASQSLLSKILSSTIFKVVTAPIREVFEEIVKDGLIEALAENLVDIAGLPEDLGFWISALATSWRETKGALTSLRFEVKTNLKHEIALRKALRAGDTNLATDLQNKINQNRQQRQDKIDAKQEQKATWRKLLGTDFFRGFAMLVPALFTGRLDFLGLSNLKNMVKGTADLAPKVYGKLRSKIQAYRINKFLKKPEMSVENLLVNNLIESVKIPADIDGAELNDQFRELQETDPDLKKGIDNLPATKSGILFDPDPRTQQRNELAKTFDEIRLADWHKELSQDYRLEGKKAEFETIRKNFKDVDFQKSYDDTISAIRDALKDQKDLRYIDMCGIVMYDPNFVLIGLPHFNPEQELDIPFNQPIKDFVNDLKRKYYSISYKIKLALFKGGEFIEIGEDSNEHIANWLIKNGYSKDETVYIRPVDKDYHGPLYEEAYWKVGNPSPYTSHFDEFRKELRDIAYKLGLINDYTYAATSRFLFPAAAQSTAYLSDTYSKLSGGYQFGRVEDPTLLKTHARLLNKLEELFKAEQVTEREYIQYTNRINALYDEQYSIYGYVYANPFYFEGRLNTHKIGDILMDYGFIDKNVLTHLYEFVRPFGGSKKALTMAYYIGEEKKYSIPKEDTFDKLKSSLRSAILDFASKNTEITNEIANEAIDKVDTLIDGFIQRIKDTKKAREVFSNIKGKFAKVELLMRIQDSHPVLLRFTSLEKLSRLLFADEEYLEESFIRPGFLKNRPEPFMLHRITFNVRKWTTFDFDNFVSESELEDIRNKVEDVIYNWRFSNPSGYTHSYVTETPRRFGRLQDKSILKLEYELMQDLTHAVSAHSDKDTMPFKKVLRRLGIHSSTVEALLVVGETSAKVRDLLKAKAVITSFIQDKSTTEQKLQYYTRALNKIEEYLAKRHLRLFEEKLVSKKGYDKRLWDDDRILAYHIISLLCRDLGFDPLTFQPLDSQLFDKSKSSGLFARHHPDIRRKFSVYLQDLLLTDNNRHKEYDAHIPLEDQQTLVKVIQDLIQNDGTGPNREITAKDVVRAFLNNFKDPNAAKFYLENYWQSGDFQKNLKDFNERKTMIEKGDFEDFIKTKYNIAYKRFFDSAMDILNSFTSLSNYKGYRLSRVFSIADIYYLKRVFNL